MKIDKKLFFDDYRKSLDKNLTQAEVDAIDDFIDMVDTNVKEFDLVSWAYIFATVYHETAQTFLPVREAFWKTEEWRKRNFKYFPYYGRGFVQITWERNYRVYSKVLGVELVKNPDLALDAKTAFKILVHGCKNGIFTGKKISDYIRDGKPNYKEMRRVVNGNDKAELIADYANKFRSILNKSLK